MPNYKLGPKIVSFMQGQVNVLCDRRIDLARSGFPLSVEKVQASILPARWRDIVLEMRAEGVSALNHTRDIPFVVESLPEVKRDAVLYVHSPVSLLYTHVYAAMDPYHSGGWAKPGVKTPFDARIDFTVFSDTEIAELVKWTNNLVTETRIVTLARKAMTDFIGIGELSGTAAHVVARWPALTVLADKDPQWRARFSEPVRNLKPYGWGRTVKAQTWYDKHKKIMAAAEMILNSSLLMDPITVKSTEEYPIVATLTAWRPLPGDADAKTS